ncbi:MAG: BspA family leucine-rich repeat surface protein, partial [bacterium]|nr:BspA family leucine-rich repeat surface protein [bacterium]
VSDLDYCVILNSEGKVEKIAVGNKSYYIMLNDVEDINSLKKEDIKDGQLQEMECNPSAFKVKLNCEFDGELKQGAEYINGQYTYRYMQEYNYPTSMALKQNNHLLASLESYKLYGEVRPSWVDIDKDGWGVILTDKESTQPVTSELCTTINGKPIVSMSYMFAGSKATQIKGLENFYTDNVTNMNYMFTESQASALDLRSFDTSNVTNMNYMFAYSQAKTLDLRNFDTSNVTNMLVMFLSSQATEIRGLENFDTSNITNMNFMFAGSQASILDLRNFNTTKVEGMGYMFAYLQSAQIKGLENFDTSSVKYMTGMFAASQAMTLDLNNFNTSNVSDMSGMFSGSQATEIRGLEDFNTSNVTNMNNMFSASKVTILDLSSFDINSVSDMGDIFKDSSATIGYARTQTDADKFNSSSNKPSGLIFVVK